MREGRVVLRGDEAHHAAKVLRVRIGETISVADGSGRVMDAVVTKIAEEGLAARIILSHDLRASSPALVLCQGLTKRERMDLVVQKSVEVGARTIVPFVAQRSIVKWDDDKRRRARTHWEGVARAAAKQCRSPWLTSVDQVADGLDAVVAQGQPMLALHEESKLHFRDALDPDPPERLTIVIGPEGGLTGEEVSELEASGAKSVTLGERILRTETAGPVALALAAYSYGILG
ncbi:MAG TPA: RsmE family RNA methyltransferase [Actinomycetota bacterium]|nr:RsmE family RNA methyltransferase [Actinomycetota bacterium]